MVPKTSVHVMLTTADRVVCSVIGARVLDVNGALLVVGAVYGILEGFSMVGTLGLTTGD